MQFNPMTKEQLKSLLPEGVYSFEVTSATEKDSKAGNPMIALSLRVVGEKGEVVFINDWLMQPVADDDQDKTKNKVWKIRQFCHSVGLKEVYEKGSLTGYDCLKKNGMAKIKIKPDQNGNDANVVSAYLDRISAPIPLAQVITKRTDHSPDIFKDSDIPF